MTVAECVGLARLKCFHQVVAHARLPQSRHIHRCRRALSVAFTHRDPDVVASCPTSQSYDRTHVTEIIELLSKLNLYFVGKLITCAYRVEQLQ